MQVVALEQLDNDLKNKIFMQTFQEINSRYVDATRKQSFWVKQRVKTFYLDHTNDDLKFLFNSIKDGRHF